MILNPFKGKNIIITGGSKGIGLCMAKRFAALKANIAIIARDKTALAAAQREIEEAGPGIRCLAYACDVTNPDTLRDYINMIRYEFGTIDGIIANSGYCHPGNFHEINIKDIDRQIDVNLKGVIYTLKFGIPHLIENGGGFIAITSSPAGSAGIFGFSIYGATKSALNIMSHILRAEYKSKNIRVHLLLPPDTDTPGYAEEISLYPPQTEAILGGGALLQPDPVAKKFVKGIANNKKIIPAGFSTRLVLFLMRRARFIWDLYANRKIRSVKSDIKMNTAYHYEYNEDPPAATYPEPSGKTDAFPEPALVEPELKAAKTTAPETQAPEPAPENVNLDDQPDLFDIKDLSKVTITLDIENIKRFLDRITKYVPGLAGEIAGILMDTAAMDTSQEKSWTIDAQHEQKSVPLHIIATMNPDDTTTISFHTTTRLALIIDQESDRMLNL